MYYALIDGKLVPVERFQWVKLQSNGVYVHCPAAEGQGIIVNGEIYRVNAGSPIDKPVIDLIWKNVLTPLKEENAQLKDTVDMLILSALEA